MDDAALSARIKEQELGLVFDGFDEAAAYALGDVIRDRAVRETLPIVCDIRTWDRPLFYCAMPGSVGTNADWVRRKAQVVKMLSKSSYRAFIDNKRERLFGANWGMHLPDYALSGGSFPIRAKGAGVIGAISISGLHEHEDHEMAVAGICDRLGFNREDWALPPRAA